MISSQYRRLKTWSHTIEQHNKQHHRKVMLTPNRFGSHIVELIHGVNTCKCKYVVYSENVLTYIKLV